jgi:Tol biopolymer transport system component
MKYRLAAVACFLLLALHFAAGQSRDRADELIFERPSNQWFEGPATQVTLSTDGQWALFTEFGRTISLVSLDTKKEAPQRLLGSLESLRRAVFCGPGTLARQGQSGSEKGWWLPRGEGEQLSSLPPYADLQCSPKGREFAYYDSSNAGQMLFVGPRDAYKDYGITGRVTAMDFTPDGSALFALLFQPTGKSTLVRVSIHDLRSTTIASDLDASPGDDTVGVSPDGHIVFVALASPGAPNNAERHQPDAPRWLKIYELNLATGARRAIVESPGQDNNDPAVIGGKLYWARTVSHDSIVVVPASGGDAKQVLADAQIPMWSPDGKKIGFSFGQWRLADWALNLDAGVVGVDADGKATTAPSVIISGYHEDFPPAWSPDGKWIAFHSHRSRTPVPEYDSVDSTDDVYLRLADDIHAPEFRLTDFGWETGPAYWSPDGQKLAFSSWVRGGQPGIDKLWILSMDTETGQAMKATMLSLPADLRSAQWSAWSPSGEEIAIEDNRGEGKRSLWVVKSDGSQGEKLLDYEGTTYGGLDWTHDGKAIIYSALAGDRLQLFWIPRLGGVPQQLTHDSGNLLHPRVSPDGRWIACTRLVQSKQIWRRPLS